MTVTESVAERLARVRERIAAAAERAGRRPDDVLLVGASKTVEPERMAAAAAAGLRDFGENYVQEAQTKQADPRLRGCGARWHLIGHLQTNKAKTAIGIFDIIQSLDSSRLAGALARHLRRDERLPVLLEVDFTGAPERTGIPPDRLIATAAQIADLAALELVGLMTVPALGLPPDETRATFRALRELRDELVTRVPQGSWRHLSMGMTDDFEIAIEEGATIVRVGRAIFGPRP